MKKIKFIMWYDFLKASNRWFVIGVFIFFVTIFSSYFLIFHFCLINCIISSLLFVLSIICFIIANILFQCNFMRSYNDDDSCVICACRGCKSCSVCKKTSDCEKLIAKKEKELKNRVK